VVESYVRAPPRGSAGEPLRRAGLVGGTLAAAAVKALLWWQNGEYRPIQPGERSKLDLPSKVMGLGLPVTHVEAPRRAG